MQLVVDVKQENDGHLIGEKGFELSTLASLGINIPDGFIITTDAYFEFLKENNLRAKVNHLLENFDKNTATHIKKAIFEANFSEEFTKSAFSFYRRLGWTDKFIFLIPSATDPNIKLSSRKVKGEASLLIDIKEIWASYFSSELILHRIHRDLSHFKTGIAIVVQKDLPIKKSLKLTPKEEKELSEIERKILDYYYFPKKISWIVSKGKIYVTQLNDVSLKLPEKKSQIITASFSQSNAKFRGITTGVVGKEIVILRDLKYDKLTDIKGAKALVIQNDDINPHLRIVLQKMGFPVVIGASTESFKNGNVVTVDATKNAVYKGQFKV